MKERIRDQFAARILILALAGTLAGCGSATQLRVDDGSSPIGSLRAVHRLNGGPGGGGIELDIQSARGKASQSLGLFETAQIGNQTIAGPTLLQNEAKSYHMQLAYNHRLFVQSPVELEWFAGVAIHRLQWYTSGNPVPTPGIRFGNTWYGPAGGVMARFKLGGSTALEMRYSAATQLEGMNGSRASAELALAWSPAQALQLRLGLADARSSYEPDDGSSDLRLRTRGPFLGLALSF